MNIEVLREFLGWCTVINFGLLFVSSVLIMVLRDWASKIHAKMFDLDEASVRRAYFQYLANFKIAVIVFNLVPYIALRIMAGG